MPGMSPEERRIRNTLSSQSLDVDAPPPTPSEILQERNIIKRHVSQSISQTVDDDAVILRDGTVAFDAPQAGKSPTLSNHLATKAYVDSSSAASGWTMAASSGSNQSILAGNTATFTGGNGITATASATDTLTIAVTNDSIGDTQLAYNTGQHLTTTSNPTFGALTVSTLDTGQGANELYDMNQNVLTTSAVTFATVDTGQGANELYDMNQNVLTSSDVTFNNLTTDGDVLVKGDDISSHPFTPGFVGSGWKIDNTGHAEFQNATIRGSLSVFELLMQQIRATNGSVIITAVAKIESISGNDLTFEDPSDNGICPFHTNDIVLVQRVNLTGTATGDNGGGTIDVVKQIVRRVSSVSGRTITINADVDGAPTATGSFAVGDDVVRIGNTDNANRDASLYLSADDSKAPYLVIKDGVDSWTSWTSASTEKARLGRLDGITDSDAGLDGNQTNSYGLYSSNVHLKGHIHATSGTIGGVSIANGALSISSSNISDVAAFDGTSATISNVDAYSTGQDKQKISTMLNDSPTGTGFFMDATNLGYYTNSAWKTYMGKNGDFYLTGSGGSGGGSLSWDSDTSTLNIAGDVTITNTNDFAPTNATANDTDANLKARGNHTGTQGATSLDSTVISGGKIITGLLTADNIQAGTLTGRTIQTSDSGQRVIMHEDDKLEFYDASNLILQLEADNSDPSLRMFNGGAIYCSGDGSIVSNTESYSSYTHQGASITDRRDGTGASSLYINRIANSTSAYETAIYLASSNSGSGHAKSIRISSGSLVADSNLDYHWFGSNARDVGYGIDGGLGADEGTAGHGGIVNIRSRSSAGDDGGEYGQALRIWKHGTSTIYWSAWVDSGNDLAFKERDGSGGYLSNSADVTNITFTGQHRCKGNSGMTTADYASLEGYIVSSSGSYDQMSGGEITIDEALPVIELSNSDNDKTVFGVVSGREGSERKYQSGQWNSTWGALASEDERIMINSLGEGGIWVTNINGNLENGDYVTSSTAAGLGKKQDDDLLHNYTVAKITQDCNFSSGEDFEHNGTTYKKQFVGCTYHCG